MTEKDLRNIEPPTRLSKSMLWQIQRNYFKSMGPEAWKEQIPFYISSNMAVAKRYATLVCCFLKDYLLHHPAMLHETFYIAELGSGTGRFSYYFLNTFTRLLPDFELQNVKFCYIVTDVTEKNVEFCQANPSFARFIEKEQIDFSCFNVEIDKDFFLRIKNKKYSELSVKAPLCIIANYVFDCIQQDMFEYHKGQFQEVKLGLSSRYKNFNIEKSLHLDELRFEYANENIDFTQYYENPNITNILKEYHAEFKDEEATVMIPLGALQFIDNMNALTHQKFFMIAGDKGISNVLNMMHLEKKFRFSYDGCISFLVNFDAIGRYLKNQGGDCLLTQYSNDFKINIFSSGITFAKLPQTANAFKNFVDVVSADEYCFIFDEYITSDYRFNVKGLISFLRFSEWDPTAYYVIHDRLYEIISGTYSYLINDFKNDLMKVENNIYELKYDRDFYVLLGTIYQKLGLEDKALKLYLKSIEIFGDKAAAFNNAGIIYEGLKQPAKALAYYEKSVSIDKNNIFAKRKIWSLTGKPYLAAIMPIVKSLFIFAGLALVMYLLSRK